MVVIAPSCTCRVAPAELRLGSPRPPSVGQLCFWGLRLCKPSGGGILPQIQDGGGISACVAYSRGGRVCGWLRDARKRGSVCNASDALAWAVFCVVIGDWRHATSG